MDRQHLFSTRILLSVTITLLMASTSLIVPVFGNSVQSKNVKNAELSSQSQINLYIGHTDDNVKSGVNSFLLGIPSSVDIAKITDFSNIRGSVLVIIAHGSDHGILGINGMIPWSTIGSQISQSNVRIVIAVSCDSQILRESLANDIAFFGHDGDMDAILGGYLAAMGTLMALKQLTKQRASNLLYSYEDRIKALENGAQSKMLSAWLNVKQTQSSVWGFVWEDYVDIKFWLNGDTASDFYRDPNALGYVILFAIGAASPVIGVIIFIVELYVILIKENSSPSGIAYFGYRIQVLPIPQIFAIIGNTGLFQLVPIGMIFEAILLHGQTLLLNTNGYWVQFI